MEIFVLEESVPCPHFTDKKTEPPPQAVTCPGSTQLSRAELQLPAPGYVPTSEEDPT